MKTKKCDFCSNEVNIGSALSETDAANYTTIEIIPPTTASMWKKYRKDSRFYLCVKCSEELRNHFEKKMSN